MKPTQLIYKAWRNTESLPYETSQEKRVIELVDPTTEKYYAEFDDDCYLCGQPSTSGIPAKRLLPKTFNDHDQAKAPESEYVCEACCFMILTNPNRRQAIRWFNYVAAETLKICNRIDLREQLLNPPEPPFVMCITISQKKHLMWYLQTSYSRERFFVTMESEQIPVERARFAEMLDFAERLYNLGITKEQLLENRIPFGKLSIAEWQEAAAQINEYKKEMQYKLAIYVARKEDDEK